MENLKSLLATVDIMNQTEAVLDTVDDLIKNSESQGGGRDDTRPSGAGDASALSLQCTECNDGERAILAGYMSLIKQCIELAEKVEAAKA